MQNSCRWVVGNICSSRLEPLYLKKRNGLFRGKLPTCSYPDILRILADDSESVQPETARVFKLPFSDIYTIPRSQE